MDFKIIELKINDNNLINQVINLSYELGNFNTKEALKEKSEKRRKWLRELSLTDRKGETRFRKAYKSWLKKTKTLIALKENSDEVIGYIIGESFKRYGYTIKKFADITELFVKEKYRNYGIGNSLLNKLIDYYREKNKADYIKIGVSPSNNKAKKIYLTKGFIPWEDELIKKIKK